MLVEAAPMSQEMEAALILMQLRGDYLEQIKGPSADSKSQLKRKQKGENKAETKNPKGVRKGGPKQKKPEEKKKKPFACDCCHKTYGRNEHLQRHKKRDHENSGERFECDICQKLFTREDNVFQHRRALHTDAGPAPRPRLVILDEDGDNSDVLSH